MAEQVYKDADGSSYVMGPDGRKIPVASEAKKPGLESIAPSLLEEVIPGAAGAAGMFDLLTNQKSKGAGALQGAASGAALGSVFPGVGTVAGGLIGGGLGLAKGFFNHKNTKEYQADNTATLAKQFKGAPADQQKLLSSLRTATPGATKESQALAMKDPTAMWGSYGMLNTFGKDYFDKMDEFQRYAATQAAIDNGLFDPEKGDMLITDAAKLKSLTEGAYKNADYRKAYDSWKKTEKSPALSSIAPGGSDPQVAAANIMAGAQKQIATQSAEQTRKQNLLGIVQSMAGQGQARVADYGGFGAKKNPYL